MEFFQNIDSHHTYSQFQFSIKIASKLACLDRMIIVLNCLLQTLSFDPLATIVKFQPQPKCHIIVVKSKIFNILKQNRSVRGHCSCTFRSLYNKLLLIVLCCYTLTAGRQLLHQLRSGQGHWQFSFASTLVRRIGGVSLY